MVKVDDAVMVMDGIHSGHEGLVYATVSDSNSKTVHHVMVEFEDGSDEYLTVEEIYILKG